MPYKIHEAATRKMMEWSTGRPQEVVPEVLPENWQTTPGHGLPVVEIPHFEFPMVLYLHPLRPFREIEHRDANFEVVGTERIPTEHLTRVICCEAHKGGGPASCADCAKLLEAALAEGWTRQPYIPKAEPKKDADLYGPRPNLLEETKQETKK